MAAQTVRADLRWLARVPVDPMTYRSFGYLLMSIPLAFAYFTILVLGVALSLGLSLLLVGPVVFVATLVTVLALARFDGVLTEAFLGAEVQPGFPSSDSASAFIRELVLGRDTWFGLLFLVWKIALGIAALLVVVVGFAMIAGLVLTPLYYGEYTVVNLGVETWTVDSPTRAAIVAGIGAGLAYLLLLVVNALGFLSRRVAEGMLGE